MGNVSLLIDFNFPARVRTVRFSLWSYYLCMYIWEYIFLNTSSLQAVGN